MSSTCVWHLTSTGRTHNIHHNNSGMGDVITQCVASNFHSNIWEDIIIQHENKSEMGDKAVPWSSYNHNELWTMSVVSLRWLPLSLKPHTRDISRCCLLPIKFFDR